MQELAEPAIIAVEEERIKFVPERYASTYLDWMRNIRDWCISRQLWWGHRIPVWTCDNDHADAYESPPEVCSKCSSMKLIQDEDVLDTWFSSALWPFATLGWPDQTIELNTFYPTTVLSTAREIINLWVSRMIFTSMKFLKKIPFKDVLIHPVIQTPDGKRMSKSKGNAIDPLDMIDKYGADANRFWYTSVGVKGDQDVRFREDRLEEYKRFANKLWNAGRFVLSQLEGYEPRGVEPEKLTLADRWILHKYNTMLKTVSDALNEYDFHIAARELYEFTWDYFCDWYVEIAKVQMAVETAENIGVKESQTRRVLHTVFEGLMRAMHPIMPFITEELWGRLAHSVLFQQLESIMFAPYPRSDERFFNQNSDEQMTFLIKVIRSIRNMRQTFNVPASKEAEVIMIITDAKEAGLLKEGAEYIKRLGRITPLQIADSGTTPKMAAKESISNTTIYLPLGDLIDVQSSKQKLLQQKESVLKTIKKIEETLNNADFRAKAPPDKVVFQESQMADEKAKLESIEAQLKILDEGA
jgi:valyl-tRNA synthetase